MSKITEAQKLAKRLNLLLKDIWRLDDSGLAEFTDLMKDAYEHTIAYNPAEPPLELDWSLSEGGVCKQLYEELTGCGLD